MAIEANLQGILTAAAAERDALNTLELEIREFLRTEHWGERAKREMSENEQEGMTATQRAAGLKLIATAKIATDEARARLEALFALDAPAPDPDDRRSVAPGR